MKKKKVLLIGDSIRMGYDKYVKNYLADSCEVYYPKDNCRFAQYTLRHLSDWKSGFNGDDLDLIHWNVGLWDTLEIYDDGCLTPPEFYAFFIEKICKRIKVLFPKAKVIFATSTPVIESVPEEYYSDMTHLYTPEGTQLLTDAVIKAICDMLDIEYREFTLADYESVKEVIGL